MKITIGEYFRDLTEEQREDLRELVAAHGFDYSETFDIEYSVIDAPTLTVAVYDRNEDGRRYLGREPCTVTSGSQCGLPDGTLFAAHQHVDVLLRHPLPDWWRDA
jgi:hypothetical protein